MKTPKNQLVVSSSNPTFITPNQESKKLAKAVGVPALFFKREDLHPLGSHKGRSIPIMIEKYAKDGFTKFAISSSGNAALAAAKFIIKSKLAVSLEIFVGKNIPAKKLTPLLALSKSPGTSSSRLNPTTKGDVKITQCERPLQQYILATKNKEACPATQFCGVKGLRQSTDDLALIGYKSLAEEISEIPNLSAIFIATSSGTTAQAIGEWFAKQAPKNFVSGQVPKNSLTLVSGQENKNIPPVVSLSNPQIHIVQTTACAPIASAFDEFELRNTVFGTLSERDGARKAGVQQYTQAEGGKNSDFGIQTADAIVDKIAFRKDAIIKIIKKTGGSGWVCSGKEIADAAKKLKSEKITTTPNGALSFAGLLRAISKGVKFSGAVVCIIGGK